MTPRFAYFDTSLLIPLYIQSRVSPLARRALVECTKNGELPVVLSDLTRLEFASTMAKYVRVNQLGAMQAKETIDIFEQHCRHDFVMLPVQPSDCDTARQWIGQMRAPLKTLDGLHMAVAFANQCIVATADRQLAAAAAIFDVEHYFVSYAQE